jgi:DNA-binding transcriptional ArsR family regulator
MPRSDFIVTPESTTPISVALEPAHNVMGSLHLLNWVQEDKYSAGLNRWLMQTLAAMTTEQLHNHRLVLFGLHYAAMPQGSWPSFPAYVDHLAAQPPVALREKLLDSYLNLACLKSSHTGIDPDSLPTKAALISSREAYLEFLQNAFPGPGFDEALESEAYDLLMDPPTMQQVIVDHLRMMWHDYMAEEWLDTRPLLLESQEAFQQVDFSGMSRLEAAEFIIGKDLPEKMAARLETAERLIFVPSPHIGAYQGIFGEEGETLWITFGARLPAGMHSSASALSRAELLVRISALSDDTRLRILGLIAREGEQCAQDIITALDLSQSAASRHLKQLSATGYLIERRRENAKCYTFNEARVNDTLDALRQYLHLPDHRAVP